MFLCVSFLLTSTERKTIPTPTKVRSACWTIHSWSPTRPSEGVERSAQGKFYHRVMQAPGISEVSQKGCLEDTITFCFILFKTCLLRFNLDAIKFTHFKCKLCWILVSSYNYSAITTIQFQNTFITRKNSLVPICNPSLLTPPALGNHWSFCLYSFAFSRIFI